MVRIIHAAVYERVEGVRDDRRRRYNYKGVHAPAATPELRVGVPVEAPADEDLDGQPADTRDECFGREHAVAPYSCMPKLFAGTNHGAPLRHEDRY